MRLDKNLYFKVTSSIAIHIRQSSKWKEFQMKKASDKLTIEDITSQVNNVAATLWHAWCNLQIS